MRRPIRNIAVLESLDHLVRTTAATDATELGLRYLRHLVSYEMTPEFRERKAQISARVQQAKKKRDPLIGTRKRGGYRR